MPWRLAAPAGRGSQAGDQGTDRIRGEPVGRGIEGDDAADRADAAPSMRLAGRRPTQASSHAARHDDGVGWIEAYADSEVAGFERPLPLTDLIFRALDGAGLRSLGSELRISCSA